MLLLAPAAFAAPDTATLASAWERDRARIDAVTPVPPHLGGDDFAVLSTGAPVAHRFDSDGGAFVTGAVWVRAPLEAAWVAIQDGVDRPLGKAVTQEWLPGASPGRRQVWMRLDLPWPLSDRQWVSDFRNGSGLYLETEGRVWQRTWSIGDPSTALHPDPRAVWAEENRGAWTLLPAGDGTLCVLTIQSVVGGSIPPEVADVWAVSTVKRTLSTFASLAPDTAAHYVGDHVVVVRPDGVTIPRG